MNLLEHSLSLKEYEYEYVNMNMNTVSHRWGMAGEGAKRPSGGGWGEGVFPLPHQGVFAFWRFKLLQNVSAQEGDDRRGREATKRGECVVPHQGV